MTRVPEPPREWLNQLTDVSDRAAAGYGWQAGYLAAMLDLDRGTAGDYHPVKAPATVAKLYVAAACDEIAQAVEKVREKCAADLSGGQPFRQLLAAIKTARTET